MNIPFYKRLLRVAVPLLALAALLAAGLWCMAELPDLSANAGRTVVINEVCVKNLTGLTDADGETGDWIELINLSGEDMVLDGWGLSDNPDRPYKWTFPEGTVLSGGANNIMVLFADGKDGYDGAGSLHTNFRLSRKGETLVLTDTDGNAVDTLDYDSQEYDLTYGRLRGDAGRVGVLAAPTPGSANSTRFLEETVQPVDLGEVTFSQQAGFYEDAFRLTLSCDDPDAAIVYTLDGSLPTTSSPIYTGPISIESREGDANEYVSLPSAFRGEWVLGYACDYAPEPVAKATTVTACVYKDGVLGEAVTTQTYWVGLDRYTLPVVSVTAQAEDLFGPEGIYVPGQTYYTLRKYGDMDRLGNFSGNQKIDARIQILDTDGTELLNADTTVRVSGGWSRLDAVMKNLHLKLQDGATSGLLAGAPGGDALDTLVLRGTGNGSTFTSLHQDAFLCNYLYGMDVGTQYNQPVVLFLQDEYWGVYTVRESKNTDFFLRHYGIEEEDLICPGTTPDEQAQPEKSAFGLGVDALDATIPEGMAWVEENVDVDEYIRYIIAQMYTYNADGLYNGGNNSILWKSAEVDGDNPYADGRWRFVLNDLDATMVDVEVDPFAYLLENEFSFETHETAPWYSVIDNLFQKLWANADFRARFAEEYRKEMETVYAPENIVPAFEAWADLLRPEAEEDLARQKIGVTSLAPLAARLLDYTIEPWEMTMDEWETQVDYVKDYLTRRADIMLDYLDDYLQLAEEGAA